MYNLLIEEIDSNHHQTILDDIQHLKEQLNTVLENSDQTRINNLFQETDLLLNDASDQTEGYLEKRYKIFEQLANLWLNFRQEYKDRSEVVNQIEIIDNTINMYQAYCYWYLSLFWIEKGQTRVDQGDLKNLVYGFYLLADTIDIFIEFLSNSHLKQIYENCKNLIDSTNRNRVEYFENFQKDRELSQSVTQLRSFSGFIILKIEKHFKTDLLKQAIDQVTTLPPNKQDTIATRILEELESESKIQNLEKKKEFIRSLRGKYANSLSSTDEFMRQKQAEIDWEENRQ